MCVCVLCVYVMCAHAGVCGYVLSFSFHILFGVFSAMYVFFESFWLILVKMNIEENRASTLNIFKICRYCD